MRWACMCVNRFCLTVALGALYGVLAFFDLFSPSPPPELQLGQASVRVLASTCLPCFATHHFN